MGFMPFLGQAGAAFLPGLLGSLGLFGQDPQKKRQQQVNSILSPANFGKLSQGFFQQGLGGPAYAQGQRQIAQGTNQAGNLLAQRMAQTGAGNSGTGALASSIAPSIGGNALANLQAQLWQASQQQAQNSIESQLSQLGQGMPPSQNMGLFAGGLSALGPLLQQWLSQMGQGGGGGGSLGAQYGGGPTRRF